MRHRNGASGRFCLYRVLLSLCRVLLYALLRTLSMVFSFRLLKMMSAMFDCTSVNGTSSFLHISSTGVMSIPSRPMSRVIAWSLKLVGWYFCRLASTHSSVMESLPPDTPTAIVSFCLIML